MDSRCFYNNFHFLLKPFSGCLLFTTSSSQTPSPWEKQEQEQVISTICNINEVPQEVFIQGWEKVRLRGSRSFRLEEGLYFLFFAGFLFLAFKKCIDIQSLCFFKGKKALKSL